MLIKIIIIVAFVILIAALYFVFRYACKLQMELDNRKDELEKSYKWGEEFRVSSIKNFVGIYYRATKLGMTVDEYLDKYLHEYEDNKNLRKLDEDETKAINEFINDEFDLHKFDHILLVV